RRHTRFSRDWSSDVCSSDLLALYADDGKGKSLQSYSIRVSRDVLPLNVSLTATPEVVQPGERVLINVFASGGQGSITRTLTLNGEALVLNSYGQAEWIASGTGRKTLNATATDGTTTVTDSLPISVATPGDTTPPQVSISAPAFDSVITAPTDVIATVQDDNLAFYQVLISPRGQQQWQVIAEGTGNVTDAAV